MSKQHQECRESIHRLTEAMEHLLTALGTNVSDSENITNYGMLGLHAIRHARRIIREDKP